MSMGFVNCKSFGFYSKDRLQAFRRLMSIALTAILMAFPRVAESQGTANGQSGPRIEDLPSALSTIQKQKVSEGIYSSDFESTFWSARTKRTRQSQGRVSYQAPNRFRWEIESPEQETYVSTGSELWKHNLAAKHAQELPLQDAGLEFLQAIVDPAALGKLYEIKAWDSLMAEKGSDKSSPLDFDIRPDAATKTAIDPNKIFASLVPRRSDAAEQYLYLIADKKTGQVDEIRIAFQNGNKNTIRFKKWDRTEGIEKLFQFEPPPGTAIDRLAKGNK